MKNLLQVSTQVDKPELLENLIEKLAIRHNEYHTISNILPLPWQSIETSSLESYLTGTMNIAIGNGIELHIPFTANFLFSCKRQMSDPYRFHWGLSMS